MPETRTRIGLRTTIVALARAFATAAPTAIPVAVAAGLLMTSTATADRAPREYVVVYAPQASVQEARAAVAKAGGTIGAENDAIGVATIRSADAGFEVKATSEPALE